MSEGKYDWHIFLLRIIAVSFLIYPAQYAAKESTEHRKLENINRKIELDLAIINPFIELLNDSTKKQIKEKLVDRYFNINNISIENDIKNKDEYVPFALVEKIMSLLGKK